MEKIIKSSYEMIKSICPNVYSDMMPLEYQVDNLSLSPHSMSEFWKIKVKLKCQGCSKVWLSSVKTRFENNGCVRCNNAKKPVGAKRVLNGINPNRLLKNIYPIIFSEIVTEKVHPDINLNNITYGSDVKLVFKCINCSKEWQAMVKSRCSSSRNGCPSCSRANRYPSI